MFFFIEPFNLPTFQLSYLQPFQLKNNNIPNKLIPFLYSIIGTSTNVNDPSHVYLLEEGLELWLVFIENSTQLNSELLELSSNIFPIIGNHFSIRFYCLIK